MTSPVTLEDMFTLIGAIPQSGPWGCKDQENGSGIYIVTSDPPKDGQPIVYIGRGKSVKKRLRQFYRHKYGEPRPHHGGQDILKLPEQGHILGVHWAYTDNFKESEMLLIKAFKAMNNGKRPMGNKRG